jgi:hypothetical protein
MDDLAGYITNERPIKSAATREVPKITIKNLVAWLKGRGIYSTKEWAERKKSKKIILQVVDQLSANKYKFDVRGQWHSGCSCQELEGI